MGLFVSDSLWFDTLNFTLSVPLSLRAGERVTVPRGCLVDGQCFNTATFRLLTHDVLACQNLKAQPVTGAITTTQANFSASSHFSLLFKVPSLPVPV